MPQALNIIQKKDLEGMPQSEQEGPGGDATDTKEESGEDTTDTERLGGGEGNHTR